MGALQYGAPAASMTDDAGFRAWVSALYTAISTVGGIVQTTDTGQINPATVVKPTATNTVAGYAMYRFNDALQATKPVFLKIEWGVGGQNYWPSMWFTVGFATNGAGALVGQQSTRMNHQNSNTQASSLASYISSSPSRLSFAQCVGSMTVDYAYTWTFNLERSRAIDGTEDGTGVYLWTNCGSTATCQFIPFTGAVFATIGYAPTMMHPGVSSAVFGTDTGVFPHLPYQGRWLNPLIGMVSYYRPDILAGSQFPVAHYGTNHNYLSLGLSMYYNLCALGGGPSSASMAIIYE